MIKNVIYFIPTFSHLFVTADKYQFSSKAADFITSSVRAKRLFTVFGNPAFCLFLYFTGARFRGELQHVGDVSEPKIKCLPIRTREIDVFRLSDVQYGDVRMVLIKWAIRLEFGERLF